MNHAPVKFVDLDALHGPILSEIRAEIEDVISSNSFALGPKVESFEEQFATYLGANHCVGVNSGTSALHLALIVAGINPGDEVITTPSTWISTSWAISYVGAKPVFVDIDPTTYCMDAAQVAQAITEKTGAILAVDLYGHPIDGDALGHLARTHGIPLIEDAAQAHGAMWNGRPCGTLGDIATFSFYPGKNLGAFGEGGAIVTNNNDWAQRLRRLRDHAQDGRHNHTEIGFNYRMEGMQGAVLSVKLRHLDRWNEARRQVAEWYTAKFATCPDIVCPRTAPLAEVVWHIYAVQHDDRDALCTHLREHDISCAVHYPTPIHLQPAYANLGYVAGDFPVAEQLGRRQLSMPMHPAMSPQDIDAIVQAVTRCGANVGQPVASN